MEQLGNNSRASQVDVSDGSRTLEGSRTRTDGSRTLANDALGHKHGIYSYVCILAHSGRYHRFLP